MANLVVVNTVHDFAALRIANGSVTVPQTQGVIQIGVLKDQRHTRNIIEQFVKHARANPNVGIDFEIAKLMTKLPHPDDMHVGMELLFMHDPS